MKIYAGLISLASLLCLAIATLSAVGVFHATTMAWFIGGVFAYVLSVDVASLEQARRMP